MTVLAQQLLFAGIKGNWKATKSRPVKSKPDTAHLKNLSNSLKIVSLQICIFSPEDDYNLLISASKTNYIIVIKNSSPSLAPVSRTQTGHSTVLTKVPEMQRMAQQHFFPETSRFLGTKELKS